MSNIFHNFLILIAIVKNSNSLTFSQYFDKVDSINCNI